MAVIKKLCDISKFDIKLPKYEITQEDIEEKINKTLEEKAVLSEKKGPINNGDIVYIDFTGTTSEGEKFRGSDGNNNAGIIGEGDFLPEFEQQLLGHSVGDNINIVITTKENFHIQEVAGKELIFKVIVNRITYKELPELNNYFIKTLKVPNLSTVDDFIEFIKASIELENLTHMDNTTRNIMCDQLIMNSVFEVSQEEIVEESKKMVKMFEQKLFYQGLILEEYLKTEKTTKEELSRKYRDDALKNIKLRTLVTYLVNELNIEVTDEELYKEADKLSLEYGYSINELIDMGAGKKEAFRADLKRKKVIEVLLERAEISFI